jgi:hypothetical protein
LLRASCKFSGLGDRRGIPSAGWQVVGLSKLEHEPGVTRARKAPLLRIRVGCYRPSNVAVRPYP